MAIHLLNVGIEWWLLIVSQIGGGPFWTVPELFFEKKQLIPALQQLLIAYSNPLGNFSSS